MEHSSILRQGRILATAVERFETPTSTLVIETVDENGVRHLRLRDEAGTFCERVIHYPQPGYSSTCVACNKLMKRIRQARSAEGQRRALQRPQRQTRASMLHEEVLTELRKMTPDEREEFFTDVRNRLDSGHGA
jgi:phage-related protein